MADFVISDTHFFDPIIIRHTKRGEFDPLTGKFSLFKDEFAMNRHMIEAWNSVVGPKDRVFHLGDFCSRCTPEQANVIFKNLNGKIVLVAGNHDIETEGIMNILKNLPFEAISEFPIVYGRYIFSHKPLRKTGTFINIHGHSHGKSEIGIDVSAEILNFQPISINSLMGKKADLDPKPFNKRISNNDKSKRRTRFRSSKWKEKFSKDGGRDRNKE
jgi:calcineurin-like phosphoesterase family protein